MLASSISHVKSRSLRYPLLDRGQSEERALYPCRPSDTGVAGAARFRGAIGVSPFEPHLLCSQSVIQRSVGARVT